MDLDKHCPLEPFNDAVDTSDLRREWEEWLRSFELLLELRQINDQHERLVLMLARGGRGLQRIYYNLRPVPSEIYAEPVRVPLAPQETPEYDNAVKRLNNFFVGKRNERVELEVFRSMKQSDESFNHFILKLRTQAARCDFRDREEQEILQQVTMGARDERVKDKGLENVMGLDELMNYAINREILMKQKQKAHAFKLESEVPGVSAVKQVWDRKFQVKRASSGMSSVKREKYGETSDRGRKECGRCGSWKHDTNSERCAARDARCNNCQAMGHFARKCNKPPKKQLRTRSTWKRTGLEINTLREGNHSDEELSRYRPTPDELVKVE